MSRSQVLVSGVLAIIIVAAALVAIALSRSSARGVQPAVTYGTEAATDWRVTAPDGANGRSGPGYANEVIHRYAVGATVTGTGRVADVQDEQWREVILGAADTVWVRAGLMSLADDGATPPPTAPPTTGPPATIPPTTGPPATIPPTTRPASPIFDTEDQGLWDVTGIVDGGALNVRSGPGVTNPVIARLVHDTSEIRSTGAIARVDGAVWREVEYRKDVRGWVKAEFLKVHVPTPVFASEKAGTWDVTGISSGALNVRKSPGTHNEVVATLPYNAVKVVSTGKVATLSGTLWREVKYDAAGRTGWVAARYLKAHEPASTSPPRGVAVMGDWNGDGIRTPGIFANGTWYLRNSNGSGRADMVFTFGETSGRPVVGDWNGDGVDTIGVVHRGTWELRNSNSAGTADLAFEYGNSGDLAVAGDWDGDGIDTPGVVRDGVWLLRNTSSAGTADLTFEYGDAGDTPIVGDWNGDGTDTPGVVRGGRWMLRNSNSAGTADLDFGYGERGDRAVVGDWNGDGIETPGFVRDTSWHLRNSASSGTADVTFTF